MGKCGRGTGLGTGAANKVECLLKVQYCCV
jgi:hypothetical protein